MLVARSRGLFALGLKAERPALQEHLAIGFRPRTFLSWHSLLLQHEFKRSASEAFFFVTVTKH
jgi:hypothetical protein